MGPRHRLYPDTAEFFLSNLLIAARAQIQPHKGHNKELNQFRTGIVSVVESTREERLEFIREEFKCLGNCPICGKCSFLRGREAEDLYADYIEGHRSFRDITAEHRNNNIK